MSMARTGPEISNETSDRIQDLIRGLRDSIEHHRAAADRVEIQQARRVFADIANQREQIAMMLGNLVNPAIEEPVETGTWLGSLRACWTSLRAALNFGDTRVVLIETERAEELIIAKFKEVLLEVVGSEANGVLLHCFGIVKAGHDEVSALRNAFQTT